MFNLLYNRFPREIGDPKQFPVNSMEDIYKYLNKKDLDVRYVNKFLGILSLEVWYRIFISKDLNPNKSL